MISRAKGKIRKRGGYMPKGIVSKEGAKKRGRKPGSARPIEMLVAKDLEHWYCEVCGHLTGHEVENTKCKECGTMVIKYEIPGDWDVDADLETAKYLNDPTGICTTIKFCVPQVYRELGLKVDKRNRFEN